MALLKYFKVKKRGPPLPNPSGLLNQQLSSSAIEEANKKVTAILCDPAKRHPYLKISPEQKAIIARYAANHGIIKAVRQFSKDFPENSLKETTIRGWKKTYLKELSSQKKAGKDMTIEKLPEKKTGRPLMLGDTLDVCKPRKFPYIMHIVDEPRKFSPSNVLTYTVSDELTGIAI